MGVKTDQRCSFCNEVRDSIEHMFWHCQHIQSFWRDCRLLFNDTGCNVNIQDLSKKLIILGDDANFASDKTFDLILLTAKYYIYKCRIDNRIPNVQTYRKYLQLKYQVEKVVVFKNMTYHEFNLAWLPYIKLVSDET